MSGVLGPYLRQGWRIAALFAVFMMVATLTAVGAPKLQREIFDDQTAHEIAGLAPISRALTAQASITLKDEFPTSPLAALFAPVGEIEFPAALTPLVGQGQYSIETDTSVQIMTETPTPAGLRDREISVIQDSEALGRVEFIRGRAPEPNPIELAARDTDDPQELQELMFSEPEPIEVALSEANANTLGLDVGSELYISSFRRPLKLEVSGVFTPVDASDLVWEAHLRALNPYIADDPNFGKTGLGAVLANPDTPQWLGPITPTQIAEARFPVVGVPSDTAELAEALLEFTSNRYTITEDAGAVAFTSQLADALGKLYAQQGTSAAALAMILTGPVGASLTVGALIALISRKRRSTAHALMLARGASTAQLRALGTIEGAIVGAPSVVIGALLGSPLAGLLLGAAPAVALAAAPLPTFHAPRSRARARWMLSGAIAVFALTGAAVYAGREAAGVDPLALSLPVLLAGSAAILLLVLLPLVMRILHRVLRRGRGVVGFLGTARATRESRAGWPILTLVLALGAAVFSSTILTTIDAGARANAYSGVGADVRLSTGWLSEEDQAELVALPGVSAGAAVYRLDSVHLGGPGEHQRVTVFAVDTALLARAQANLPEAMDLTNLAEGHGGEIPAVTAHLKTARDPDVGLRLGSWFPLDVQAQPEAVPGIADDGAWVVVDINALPPEARAEFTLPRLMLFATDGQPSTAEAIHALGGGVVSTPNETLEAFTDSPLVGGLATLSWWALVFSAVLAAVGVALFLALAAPERGYVAGILHTLGGRAGAGLAAWEVVPAVAAGILGGLVVGTILPFLTSLDLRPFTGGAAPPELIFDWPRIGLAAAIVGAVALVGVAASAVAGGRRAARALRIGE